MSLIRTDVVQQLNGAMEGLWKQCSAGTHVTLRKEQKAPTKAYKKQHKQTKCTASGREKGREVLTALELKQEGGKPLFTLTLMVKYILFFIVILYLHTKYAYIYQY